MQPMSVLLLRLLFWYVFTVQDLYLIHNSEQHRAQGWHNIEKVDSAADITNRKLVLRLTRPDLHLE